MSRGYSADSDIDSQTKTTGDVAVGIILSFRISVMAILLGVLLWLFEFEPRRNIKMIKVFVVVLLAAAGLAAQAVPVCMAVTVDQAKTLIGPAAKRSKDPSGCQWGGDKGQLNVMRVGVASMFERARTASAAKGKVQSENGLGGTAFSTIPTADKGARAAIYVLKGDAILMVDIAGIPAGGAEAELPQLRDLARSLLPKL